MPRTPSSEVVVPKPLPDRLHPWRDAALSAAQRLPLGSSLLWAATVRRLLKASQFFAGCDDEGLAAIAASTQRVALPAGRTLFRQGDAGDDLYLVARGALCVLATGEGEGKILDEVGTGALLGVVSMLSGERRSASVRTATRCTLVRIACQALFPLLETNPSMKDAVWSAFAQRRFDELIRKLERFQHLGHLERQQWIQRGRHQELMAGEATAMRPGPAFLFVLTGKVEVEQGGSVLLVRAPALVEVKGPLRAVAQESARIVQVPPLEAPLPAASVPLSA